MAGGRGTAPSGLTLGELRNFSVQLARYPLVCQWDDDDLYHPRRLETQFAYLKIHCADFCFLTDQLHFFEDTNMKAQHAKQKAFLAAALGAPTPWTGKDMRKAHENLDLREEDLRHG